jgi:zinc transport system permease protein
MELFQYDFMRRAFVVGVLLAIMIPCIGVVVVLRRLSMIGDALSHASLAGVAAGLLMGANPIVGSVTACVVSALGVEAIRKKIPRYAELSIAVALSAGVGLAGILSGFLPGSAGFNSFLFGSIVAITDFELGLVVAISVLVTAAFFLLYKELLSITFDERGARLSGVAVGLINFVFTLLTAVAISVAARTVGALMVSSLMVIPVISAMRVARSYRGVIGWAVCFAVLCTLVGLMVSYYLGLRPGATIVITGVVCLLVILSYKQARGALQKQKRRAGL